MSGRPGRGSRTGLVAAILVAACLEPAAAQAPAEFQKERQLLAWRLWALNFILPDASVPEAEEAAVQALAARAGLPLPDFKRLPTTHLRLTEGQPRSVELHNLEVTGHGEYHKVNAFLSQAGSGAPMIGVEALRLTAAPGGMVSYVARLGLPCFAAGETTPTAADAPFPWTGVPADEREAYLRDARRFRVKAEVIADLMTRQARSPVRAVALLTRQARDATVALTEARLDGDFVVEGVLIGAAARARLRGDLERAGVEVTSLWTRPAGACRVFSARGRLAPAAGPVDDVWFDGLFDDRTADACRVEPPSLAKLVTARGAAAAGTGQRLTLRLRDVDTADVLSVLHHLTGQAFVVDDDLTGRLDVDLDQVTLEEALGALASAGIAVSPPGVIRRVSRSGAPVAPPAEGRYTGQPSSLSLKRSDLFELLSIHSDVSGLQVAVHSGPPSESPRSPRTCHGTSSSTRSCRRRGWPTRSRTADS